MPLIVSESKSSRDPNQTYLTQALLDPRPVEEEEHEMTFTANAQVDERRPSSGPDIQRQIDVHHLSCSVEATQMKVLPSSLAVNMAQNEELKMTNLYNNPAYQCEYVDYSAEFTMKSLGWLTCPVTSCLEDTELPAISVYSDPEVTEELEMIIHSNGEGTAQTSGQRRVQLRSQGTNKPSVATFEGIHIKRAGLYVVEVHSVRNPELSLVADHPITIVPKFTTQGEFGESGIPEELGMAKVQMWGA